MKTKEEQKTINAYSVGPICLSVCCHRDFSIPEITAWVNLFNPTGLENQWEHSKDNFRGGEPNPCQCEKDEDCKHYLFKC